MYTAARTCYSAGTPSKIHKDIFCSTKKKIALVNAVITMGHHSVLEHVSMTLSIEGISRNCSHQLVRHRIGVSFSQQSQRYVKDCPDFVTPPSIEKDKVLSGDFNEYMQRATDFYHYLLESGIEAEDARFVLPGAACTNLVMTVNARELIEMCKVRLCTKAQWEIRNLFKEIRNIIHRNKQLSFLSPYLTPKCDWIKFCPEGDRGCGKYGGKK